MNKIFKFVTVVEIKKFWFSPGGAVKCVEDKKIRVRKTGIAYTYNKIH
jgi:hypothetical protein